MTLALLFPGQGAQKTAMMADLGQLQVVRETFNEAAAVLGQDLWALISGTADDELNKTAVAQPLMLTVGVATFRAYRHLGGIMPAYVAGHSLGEYTALTVAGTLAFADALELVRCRAEYMQAAVPLGKGAMAAILGLDAATVTEICKTASKAGSRVEPANYNSPQQIVISGDAAAVAAAQKTAAAAGAKKTVLLPVSVPSHCSLMRSAALKLAASLELINLEKPKIAVINNVEVKVHKDPAKIKEALIRQLYSPVRWSELMLYLAAKKITAAAECAPTRVLTDLAKRCGGELSCTSFLTLAAMAQWIKINCKEV